MTLVPGSCFLSVLWADEDKGPHWGRSEGSERSIGPGFVTVDGL